MPQGLPIRQAENESTEDDFALIREVFDSGWFSPGPMVERFEKEFAEAHDSAHAIMVNSGTDALRLSLLALKEAWHWPDGAEVIVPALTFVASVNAITQARLAPAFVDVRQDDCTMDPDDLLGAYTQKTVAIMPVHLFGHMAHMNRIMAFAEQRGLVVVEDSCEAMGIRTICNWGSETQANRKRLERSVGSFGQFGCFSTYACHLISTGSGGIITTSDDSFERLARSYANHGRDPDFLGSYAGRSLPMEEAVKKRFLYYREGYSCRASEFQAALGIGQLARLKDSLERRRKVAKAIHAAIVAKNLPLRLPVIHEIKSEHAWMMFPLVISPYVDYDRDAVCLQLEKDGIETRPLMPLLTQPLFANKYDRFFARRFPVALEYSQRGFYVPCHGKMTGDDASRIAQSLEQAFRKDPVHA